MASGSGKCVSFTFCVLRRPHEPRRCGDPEDYKTSVGDVKSSGEKHVLLLSSPQLTTILRSVLLEGTITLEIGPNRVEYHVHKALLVYHSEYFQRALEGPWKETENGVFTLIDVQPTAGKYTLNIFTHWLYCQTLPDGDDSSEWRQVAGGQEEENVAGMIQAYIFADRFLVPIFRRVINDKIIDYFDGGGMYDIYRIPETGIEAFSNIPADRPVLQFLVDHYCEFWDGCCHVEQFDPTKASPAFLARLVRRFSDMLVEERHGKENENEAKVRCYYEHADEEETTDCGKQHMQYDGSRGIGVFHGGMPCPQCGPREREKVTGKVRGTNASDE
ncbi:hypothetical protein HBI73_034740 [Parastagonospora nodorum]|nr:hypothetical protein HBH51_160600 [Parastagonospora nodorum]KAH4037023.1 hypothetical protein HBI09_064940 [Parastagonospora nodorum]KAH4107540.1 hypothetical protein HBH46_055450 [Parastagonospora nodorum]KAH4176575.1 hypothetical protein HBH43_060730 [Parastagonospora nodorum]KAH4252819.1 hypothetical protein HBI03_205510 [Parastagonospora nodorum]